MTFNHGVEGSSPSALTKLSPFYKGFLKTSPQASPRKPLLGESMGRVRGNGGPGVFSATVPELNGGPCCPGRTCGEVFDMHGPETVLMHVPHITATETIRRHV